jgi:gliding motility-associated-like protein
MTGRIFLILMFISVYPLRAQICTGSLGDPIINITFGSGPNPGTAISSAATNYQYVSTDCPLDGYYALRNSTAACFANTWHTITDHTGNANGYFMLVNASVSPGAFYLDTVKELCSNTTYEFAAWILNILKPSACGGSGIRPNLTFRLEKTDATVLRTYSTNDIPASAIPQWNQFGFFFTTPPDVSDVIIRIINNANGGCGNDIALDDITFRPCGPRISASISGTTSNNVSVCEGTPRAYSFDANISVGFNNAVVQWQENFNDGGWTDIPGATSLNYSTNFSGTTPPGNYLFRLAAAETGNISASKCRIVSLPLTVQVVSNPPPIATANSPVCQGNPVLLVVAGVDAVWTGPNGFSATGTSATLNNAQPSSSGRYYVTTMNNGCSRNDSVMVVVDPKPVVTISDTAIGICQGDSRLVNIYGAESYTWLPAAGLSMISGTLSAHPLDSTRFNISGANLFGCTDTVTLQVNVWKKPLADAGTNVNIMEGSGVYLSAAAKGDSVFYYWTPVYNITGIQSLSPLVNPVSDTTYIFHVVSGFGCGADEDSVQVHVFKKLIIPNAFSPNKDAVNDTWNIKGIETYPGAVITVFDRYGQMVFNTSNFKEWDGSCGNRILPVGVYHYLVSLPGDPRKLAGWVLLIR